MSWIEWLKDEKNQGLLKFLGSSLVAIVATFWTGYHVLYSDEGNTSAIETQVAAPVAEEEAPAATVTEPTATETPSSSTDTFYDASTGLEWQDDSDAKTVYKDWEGAKSYCENLTLDGYSDWRLPSKEELESIVDKSRTPMIKEGFKNTATDDWYWSASPNVGDDSVAWVVGFYSGDTNYFAKTYKSYVRCVRGRQ